MSNRSEPLCPYCMTPVDANQAVTCGNCSAQHHAACLAENAGCVALGCRAPGQARTLATGPYPTHPHPASEPSAQAVQLDQDSGRGFLWSALAAVSMIALLALGSVGALFIAQASEEQGVETATASTPQDQESEGGQAATQSGRTTTPTHLEAPSETECSYMTAPAVGEYIVILDSSEAMYQSNTSLGEACDVAAASGGDVLDTSKYWELNLDRGHKGLWTIFSGSYDTKSTAENVAVSYGYDPYGSDSWRVRWIGPCDRGDGYACVP